MLISIHKVKQISLLTLIFTCIILSIVYVNTNPFRFRDRVIESYTSKTDRKYPGSFVGFIHPYPSNYSYCNFNYGFPENFQYTGDDLKYPPELGNNSDYRVIYNVIQAKDSNKVPGVTYATHVSADFTNYIAELVRYYDGPISVAAFAPGVDATNILQILHKLCYCLPEMSRVSVHFVFDDKLLPVVKKSFRQPKNCILPNSEKYITFRTMQTSTMYPINVCRNVARTFAKTQYVLVSDIQLLPSDGLSTRFMNMIVKYHIYSLVKTVFVVPVFEVEYYQDPPINKTALVELIKSGRAVYFHKMVCTHCQKFPALEKWLESDSGTEIEPFISTKREIPYQRWEPIYIGTSAEPLYNEVLSWEGLQDKMLQMLEMCLLDYKFIILDGAFLVHWPGIKKMKNKEENWRDQFKADNSRQYNRILRLFLRKYQNKPKCKAQ